MRSRQIPQKFRVWVLYEVFQNSQKFRVGIRMLYPYAYPHQSILQGHTRTPGILPRAYRTYRSSGYGYEYRTELTELPIRVNYPGFGSVRSLLLQNTTFSRKRVRGTYGYCLEVLQNSQKFRVGIRMLYPCPYPLPASFPRRAYPYPGYCATGVQNSQQCWIRL